MKSQYIYRYTNNTELAFFVTNISSNHIKYTVKLNDSILSIAKNIYGIEDYLNRYNDIFAANPTLTPYNLHTFESILVPYDK